MNDPEDKQNGIRKAETESGRWRNGWGDRQKSLTRHDWIKKFGIGNRYAHFINEWMNEELCACNLCMCSLLRKIDKEEMVKGSILMRS